MAFHDKKLSRHLLGDVLSGTTCDMSRLGTGKTDESGITDLAIEGLVDRTSGLL